MIIQRLNDIDHLDFLQHSFEHESGLLPLNVSSWNVTNQFREKLIRIMRLPQFGNAIDYLYTYGLPDEMKEKIITKLCGRERKDLSLIITPNNTISIINLVHFLKKRSFQRICVVNPSYFSVSQSLASFGIKCHYENMIRSNNSYSFPLETILRNKYDVVWITSPIYSTGVYWNDSEISKLQVLIDSGVFVVADESFAINGYELIRKIARKSFITIYSPHKSICFNGVKFSAILCPNEYEAFFDQWVDVFSGNLPLSSIIAAKHFLTDNFAQCNSSFQSIIENSRDVIQKGLQELGVSYDTDSKGNLMTVYFADVSFISSIEDKFFLDIFRKTYASFYPGYLHGFCKEIGFSFRINLALYNMEFRGAVNRLAEYFIQSR